ncbi:MAG: hypothetical protein R2864_11235 [Syntrophotaleaceae bacterium]
MQGRLLQDWLPVLRSLLPIHLETNGTLGEAFAPLAAHVDWVSMDIKLASQTGEPTPWAAHGEFLALAAGLGCCKVVVGPETPVAEVLQAAELLRRKPPKVQMILQPITRQGRVGTTSGHLLLLQEQAARIHPW